MGIISRLFKPNVNELKRKRDIARLIRVALENSDHNVRYEARNALVQLKDPSSITPLISALTHKHLSARANALDILGQIANPQSVEPIIASLEDSDSDVRKSAANVLGNFKDVRAVPALVSALEKDNSSDVREAAAGALGRIKDQQAIKPLIDALRSHSVQRAACSALEEMNDARAIEPLIAAISEAEGRSSTDESSFYARQVLKKITDPNAIDILIAGLKHSESVIRQTAATVLGNMKDSRAVDALIAAIKDSDYGLQRAAADALRNRLALWKDHRIDVALAEYRDRSIRERLAKCDAHSAAWGQSWVLSYGDGYLVEAAIMRRSSIQEKFIDELYQLSSTAGGSGMSREEARREIEARQGITPWLICDKCFDNVGLSETDKRTAKDRATKWWNR